MKSAEPRNIVVLSDAMDLRRAAYLTLLGPWASESNLEILECEEETALRALSNKRIALEILVLGAARIENPVVLAWLAQRRLLRPNVPLALISDHEDRAEVTAALRHGVCGFFPSSMESGLARCAFGFVLAGGTFFPPLILKQLSSDGAEADSRESDLTVSLTPREMDVLAVLREGKSNKLIASDLSLCEATVKVYVRQIMRKLGAANRTQVALTGYDAVSASYARPIATKTNGDNLHLANPHPVGSAAPTDLPTQTLFQRSARSGV